MGKCLSVKQPDNIDTVKLKISKNESRCELLLRDLNPDQLYKNLDKNNSVASGNSPDSMSFSLEPELRPNPETRKYLKRNLSLGGSTNKSTLSERYRNLRFGPSENFQQSLAHKKTVKVPIARSADLNLCEILEQPKEVSFSNSRVENERVLMICDKTQNTGHKKRRLTAFCHSNCSGQHFMESLDYPPILEKKPSSKRSFSSYDIENLDLKKLKQENNLILFYVPFDKYSIEEVKYDYKSFEKSKFECFYKSSDIADREHSNQNTRFKEIINLFPTRWQKIIPFSIEKKLMFMVNKNNETLYNTIIQCLLEFEEKTVLKFRFVTRDKNNEFMYFTHSSKNRAVLGRHKGANFIKLKNNATKTDVFHHIMHSLGFMHQHKTNNGQVFVYLSRKEVLDKNLVGKKKYVCISGVESGGYDERSVLNAQSCRNMISFKVRRDLEGVGLSEVDCLKVNFFYDDKNYELSDEEVDLKLKGIKEMAEKSLINDKVNEVTEIEDSLVG